MSVVKSLIVEGSAGGGSPNEIERIVPTLFVGLGGSGKEVLMRLRKRFHDRQLKRDPGHARFVFVDTDAQSFVPENKDNASFRAVLPEQGEMVVCPITKTQFDHTFRNLADKVDSDHLSWLKGDMSRVGHKSLEHGAGTHRQFGRLAFFLNSNAIRRTIKGQLDKLLEYAAKAGEVDDGRVEVVIVTSLAGGTGSGMFIDAAYLTRDILNSDPVRYGRLLSKSITLFAYLPGMFRDKPSELPKKKQNAYAALLELEYYGTPRTGDEVFVGAFDGKEAHSRGTRFSAAWDGAKPTRIDGPGWDTCFLVDDVNNLNSTGPLPLGEIYQMTADYLFIDFERHRFAVSKRSTRANLVQFMERRKETRVRRQTEGIETQAAWDSDPNKVIYATQNGCRYSTFGLAEVYFDVERIYQAAGYRLAWHLVKSRWLGKAGAAGDLRLKEWAAADLLNPKPAPDEPAPPSFKFDAIADRLFERNGVNARSVARQRAAKLGEIEPAAGLSALRKEVEDHRKALARGQENQRGGTRAIMAENRSIMAGDPTTLGPLRTRLRDAAAGRFSRYGARALIDLLRYYRDVLDSERERAKQAAKSPVPGDECLARLAECELVPGPFRKLAQGVEFPTAHAVVSAKIDATYEKAAGEEAEPLYPTLARYVGAADQPDQAELARHKTLHQRYSDVVDSLDGMEAMLKDRFTVSSREDEQHETRRFSLSVGWDESEYDKRINEALVLNPNIGGTPADATTGRVSFDWRKLEAKVLERIREIDGGVDDVRDLAGLFFAWIDGPLVGPTGLAEKVELVAEACRFVLRKTDRAGGLQFKDDEGYGNVTDFLVTRNDRREKAENMVKASDVYFPTIPTHQVAESFRPAYFNLYAQFPAAHPKNRARNDKLVFDTVREIAENKGQKDDSGRLGQNALASEVNSLVLAREMTGFPLQFYAGLDELKRFYEENTPTTGSNNECHIDYNVASDDLPDIANLSTDTYIRIRESIGRVLRAMQLEIVNWRHGAFHVEVPDPIHADYVDLRLGSRLHRAVKTACEHDRISKYLDERCRKWEKDASPVELAALYLASRKTYKSLDRNLNLQKKEEESSPLRTCFAELVVDAEKLLKQTPAGARLHEAIVRPKSEDPADDPYVAVVEKIEACLDRMDDHLPIQQIRKNKLKSVQLPPEPSVAGESA